MKIDTEKWITQQKLAEKTGATRQLVQYWVKESRKGKHRLKILVVPEWGMTLVDADFVPDKIRL